MCIEFVTQVLKQRNAHVSFPIEMVIGAHKRGLTLAIPIALYRPQIGPPARNGKKWTKNGFWPHREKGEKMAEKWDGHF